METYATPEVHGALAALGDPTRRAILELVARGPCPVASIAAEVPVSRPAVSQHLKTLKTAGLVIAEAVGNQRFYRIDPKGLTALHSYVQALWTDSLERFKEEAEG